MLKTIDCPVCDERAKLISEEVSRNYKGIVLIIQEYYYWCKNCNFEFTTNEIDEINIKNIKKEYEQRK